MIDLYLGLATAAIVVLFCTAYITSSIRYWLKPLGVLECPFCFSWWIAAAAILYETVLSGNAGDLYWLYSPIRLCAIVCIANVAILLIHLSMATVTTEEEDE